MQLKVAIGAVIAAALLGIGVLAGSVIGFGSASAQGPNQVPTAAPSTPNSGTTRATPVALANPGKGGFGGGSGMHGPGGPGGFRGPGGFGPGPGDRFGYGPGPGGFGPRGGNSADAANRVISSTTSLINLVKGDLAYANGKMDTTDVQRWVNGADSLLQSAQDANSSSRYGQAIAYARAAGQLAEVAETQMAQKLGADKLPSYSQRPQRPNGWKAHPAPGNANTAITQAEASRILRDTYNHLISVGALVKDASNTGGATTYLTDAQNAYKASYDAYQAGNYNDAEASARLAAQLGGVADAVLQAANQPGDANTPVTVPAPNFQ